MSFDSQNFFLLFVVLLFSYLISTEDMKTTEQQKQTKKNMGNLQFAARAEFITERLQSQDDEQGINDLYIFGITNLHIWYPRHQSWIFIKNMPFTVEAESLELARSEFYARWKTYISRKLGINYLKIESL